MIPLFKPFVTKELPELDIILHSGQLAYGKYSRNFESDLCKYIGIENISCTNSFNTAYLIAIKALGIKLGDRVIASPMSCLASSQPLALSGLNIAWADIDPATGTLDPDAVRKKITTKTKAIFHNHFCGYVGYVEEIRKIADDYGLLLIDDISEAFGSEWNGKKAGNWGADATVYSFQTVRLPNSIDGGAISFKNKKHFAKALFLRDYGIDRSRFRDEIGEISKECDITMAAYGALPSDVNSYIGSKCLEITENLISTQRANALQWIESLSPEYAVPLKPLEGTNPNYWVFGTKAKDKRKFIEFMRENEQYMASTVHFPNNYYALFQSKRNTILKGVEEFFKHFVALPCGWWMKKRTNTID